MMNPVNIKEITEVTGREIEGYLKMKLYTEITLIKEKLVLFEKKYGCPFAQFEKAINDAPQEDFEKWDDYMEWKAFHKKYYHLKKRTA